MFTRYKLRDWIQWFRGDPMGYPNIVSVHDAHTAHQHLEDVVLVQESQTLQSEAPKAAPATLSRHLSAKHAYRLQNVYVWMDEGIVMTPGGALIAETLPSHYRFVKMLRAGAYEVDPSASRSVDTIDECTSLKGGRYFGNYYHWWIDEIPRLQALQHVGPVPAVTVPSAYPSQLVELVQKLVSEGVRIRQADHRNESVHAREFLFLPPVTEDYCGYLPSSFISNLRRNVIQTISPNRADETNRRYYVSRNGSTKRCVLNEQEVIGFLEGYGFEDIRPETLSQKEQIRRFSRAEWIVGAHGAGLTNMMFSPDCTVVELFPGAPFTHYRWLSESLGHTYYNVVGDPKTGKHADFEVDVSALQRILDESL